MHLGHQGCADTKERARMPTRLAFRTILGSSENGVALVPETGVEPIEPDSVKTVRLVAKKEK